MGDVDTDDLIEAAQPNALLMRVDAMCERRAWSDLTDLARRCRQAVERGKQLWPIAEHIDYRLALQAPAPYAASVLAPDAGRFALGPLTEVAASTHTFKELEPHLESPLVIGVVAAERVVRGEDLRGSSGTWGEVMELPMALQAWEPRYQLAVYRSDKLHAPAPDVNPQLIDARPTGGDVVDDPALHGALMDLVVPWVSASNGKCECAVVDGPASAAIGHLGVESFRMGPVGAAEAMALMAWAAASGGAYGRRRGAAVGRSAAWWAAATLCEMEWPAESALLGEEISKLRWYWFEPDGMAAGWNLNLAVEDPSQGWAAAIKAEDRAD